MLSTIVGACCDTTCINSPAESVGKRVAATLDLFGMITAFVLGVLVLTGTPVGNINTIGAWILTAGGAIGFSILAYRFINRTPPVSNRAQIVRT